MSDTRGRDSATNSETTEAQDAPVEVDQPKDGAGWRTWAIATVATAAFVAAGFVFLGSDNGADAGDGVVVAADGSEQAEGPGGLQGGDGFPGGGFGANGEVTAIEGTTLTVEVPSDASSGTSTRTVETDDDTEIVETLEGSLDDLELGAEVVVVGEETDGVVAATTISEGGSLDGGRGGLPGGGGTPPEGFERPNGGELPDDFEPPEGFEPPDGVDPGQEGPRGGGLVSGSVTSIDGSTLTVETDGGPVTVKTDAETTVLITVTRSFADIQIGDTVQATGETTETDDGDATVDASRIQIGALGFGRGGGFGGGGFTPPSGDESTS